MKHSVDGSEINAADSSYAELKKSKREQHVMKKMLNG